jgi:hypothetical protein
LGNFFPTEVNGEKEKDETMSTSRLQWWCCGTYTEIGRNKLSDVGKNGFEDVVAEFAPQFENQK